MNINFFRRKIIHSLNIETENSFCRDSNPRSHRLRSDGYFSRILTRKAPFMAAILFIFKICNHTVDFVNCYFWGSESVSSQLCEFGFAWFLTFWMSIICGPRSSRESLDRFVIHIWLELVCNICMWPELSKPGESHKSTLQPGFQQVMSHKYVPQSHRKINFVVLERKRWLCNGSNFKILF